MNLEFQSTGKSTINGLMGSAAKAVNARIDQKETNERSNQFKDLLNQSKQDVRQADRQLETIRENQKDSQAIKESRKAETKQVTSETPPKDTRAEADNIKSTENEPKDLKIDKEMEDSSLVTAENAQLMGLQNVQGGLEKALTNFNIILGGEENGVSQTITVQDQTSQLFNTQAQTLSVILTEDVSPDTAILIDDSQISAIGREVADADKNQDASLFTGLIKKAEAELTDGLKTVDSLTGETNQTVADNELNDTNIDLKNQQNGDGSLQMNESKSDNVNPQKVTSAVDGFSGLEQLNADQAQLNNIQDSLKSQTERQSLGEKGIQEVNASGLNPAKSSEVPTSSNTPVVQQVAQKILQNFEPNKPMVLQMTLSPDNLGDIDVQLKYDQGKLVIDIMAASQETQNHLSKQINQLVRGLALQNVHVETVHLNTSVEASSTGENTASLMNSGPGFSQQQNNAQLRESLLRNSSIQNSLPNNGVEESNDAIISIAQNLQYNGQRRINYLI